MKALRIFCLGLILTAVTTVWAAPDVLMEIYNPNTEVTSYVAPKEAHTYLKSGWQHKSTTKGANVKIRIDNPIRPGEWKDIEPNEFNTYHKAGWIRLATIILMYDPTGLRPDFYVPTTQIGDYKAEGWEIYTGSTITR